MSIHLVVSKAFEDYKRGDIITDPAEIAAIRKSSNQHNVVRSISKPQHLSGEFFGLKAKEEPKREVRAPRKGE